MKILVCGSRSFDDWRLFLLKTEPYYFNSEDYTEDGLEDFTVISGGAIGADFLARVWAKYCGYPYVEYPADWKTHGKKAGIIRNQEMLAAKPDVVLAFWDGKSSGTKHMIDIATEAKVKVEVVNFT